MVSQNVEHIETYWPAATLVRRFCFELSKLETAVLKVLFDLDGGSSRPIRRCFRRLKGRTK